MKPHIGFRRLAIALVVVAWGASLLYPATAQAAGLGHHLVAGGLNDPAAFTFTPGGNIFYGERDTGEIHILAPAHHTNRLFFTVPNVVSQGERGLLGIALHPNFPGTPFVYAYVTRLVSGHHENQIVRITDSGGRGKNLTVIFRTRIVSPDGEPYHNGGRIRFGPDGMLYAIVGEAHNSANAQNRTNPAGKILRMTPGGKPAPGNPFIGSSTNRIVKGANMGWGPKENDCSSGKSPYNTNNSGPAPRVLPKRWYTPTIAPTGDVFCQGCHLGPKNRGRLFFGVYKTSEIRRVTLTSNRLGVVSQSTVFTNSDSVLSMERGPGGGIYFSDTHHIYKLVRT